MWEGKCYIIVLAYCYIAIHTHTHTHTHTHMLSHTDVEGKKLKKHVWQKPTKFCKAIILQLKKKKASCSVIPAM